MTRSSNAATLMMGVLLSIFLISHKTLIDASKAITSPNEKIRIIDESLLDKLSVLDISLSSMQIYTQNNANSNSGSTRSTFKLGWYDSIGKLTTPELASNEGSNILIPYTGTVKSPTIYKYLDASRDAGMKIVLELPREEVKLGKIKEIIEYIKEFKEHPSIYGWYIYDEPEVYGVSAENLKKVYQAIKNEDPKRPVAMAFGIPEKGWVYKDSTDIILYDYYPCIQGSPEFSGFKGNDFRNRLEAASNFAKGKSNFWFVMQAFGEDESGKAHYWRRLPTPAESRYMFYTAVLSGVNGIIFFNRYKSNQTWIDTSLTPIVKEFKKYEPIINSSLIKLSLPNKNKSIESRLYASFVQSKYWIIAVNHSSSVANNFSIKIESKFNFNNLVLQSSGKKIPLKENNFSDSLKPYEVKIYEAVGVSKPLKSHKVVKE